MVNSNPTSSNSLDKHHFTTLTEFTQIINSFQNLNDLANFLLLTLMGKFLLTRCGIIIVQKGLIRLQMFKGVELTENIIELSSFGEFKEFVTTKFIDKGIFNHYQWLYDKEELNGILLYSFHQQKNGLTENEKSLFDSLLRISSIAIKNLRNIDDLKELNKKLHLKISFSRSLLELSKEFSLLLNEDEVYKFLSYTIMGNFLVNKFALIKVRGNDKEILGSNFNDDLIDILDQVNLNELSQTIDLENSSDEKLGSILKDELQIALMIPLEIKNKQIGLMLCGNKLTNQKFTEEEIEFIESLGSIAAISMENIRLFRESLEKQKIEEDIRIAREIQRNLFPSKFPSSYIFEFYGFNEPSKQVGGDYYDVFRLNEHQILILIADVVGKGIPASLVMSNLQATVKALTRIPFNLRKTTTILNNLMKQNLNAGSFITLFWGILNEENKTLEYVNAGHNPPILIRNSEIKLLDKGGILLGVLDLNENYDCDIIELKKNDLICLFTDGFIEAQDRKENEFGEDKFLEKLFEYRDFPLETITHKLIDEIISFSDNSPSLDDLTILFTRVKN